MIATDIDFLEPENIGDSESRLFRDYLYDSPQKLADRRRNTARIRAAENADRVDQPNMLGLTREALRDDMQRNIEKYELKQSKYTGIPTQTYYGLPVNRNTFATVGGSGIFESFGSLGLMQASNGTTQMHPLLFLLLLLICILLVIKIGQEITAPRAILGGKHWYRGLIE